MFIGVIALTAEQFTSGLPCRVYSPVLLFVKALLRLGIPLFCFSLDAIVAFVENADDRRFFEKGAVCRSPMHPFARL